MLPDKDIGCHRTGFTKKCRDLVTKGICNRWKLVPFQNPTTEESISQYDCIDNWLFILQLHALKLEAETAASVDKLHNGRWDTIHELITAAKEMPDTSELPLHLRGLVPPKLIGGGN